MKARAAAPILLACYPVLFVYAHNIEQIRLPDLWGPLVLALLIPAALFLACHALMHDAERAALLVVLWSAVFWSSHFIDLGLRSATGGTLGPDPRRAVLLAVVVLLLFLAALLVIRVRALPPQVTTALLALTVALVGWQIVGIVPREATRAFTRADAPSPPLASAPDTGAPNIVHLVLDGYGRVDVLRTRYGFDNEPFLSALERRGCYVFRASRANYALTPLCLAAMLNLDYVSSAGARNGSDTEPLRALLQRSRVRRELAARGYRFVAFASGWPLTEFRTANDYRPASRWNSFEVRLLSMTPVPVVASLFGSHALDFHAHHRERVLSVFRDLPGLDDRARPLYVFAHLMSPHPPFVFAADGAPVAPDRPYTIRDGDEFVAEGGTRAEYRAGYVAQLRYLNGRILAALDALEDEMTRPTIIIIHGDHGPGMGLHFGDQAASDLPERLTNFSAVRYPDRDYTGLRPDMSSVNIYRDVFSRYFGADEPPLPDRSYFADWQHLYTPTEVDPALPAATP